MNRASAHEDAHAPLCASRPLTLEQHAAPRRGARGRMRMRRRLASRAVDETWYAVSVMAALTNDKSTRRDCRARAVIGTQQPLARTASRGGERAEARQEVVETNSILPNAR